MDQYVFGLRCKAGMKVSRMLLFTMEKRLSKHRLQKKYKFLKALKKLKHLDRTAILPFLSSDGCCTLYECIHNVMENSASRNRLALRQSLKKKKKDLRYIISPHVKESNKKRRLNKIGGGILTTILAAGIPLLLSVLGKKT